MSVRLFKILIFNVLMLWAGCLAAQQYANNSVLEDGTLYKIGVVEEGVYRISFDELALAGVDVASLNPNKISMYGNIATVLPEANNTRIYDDLQEMSILVDNDGIVFYGQASAPWQRTDGHILHQTNYYSDTAYYFLKIDNQLDGNRITAQEQSEEEPSETITSFLDKDFHEIDLRNYYHRGRKWYGEEINGENKVLTIPFSFKNAIITKPGYLESCFVGSSSSENFNIRLKINGSQVGDDISINKVGEHYFGVEKTVSTDFSVIGDNVNVSFEVLSDNAATLMWLDYVTLNVWRSLVYDDKQLQFSWQESGQSNTVLVKIGNASNDMVVLDIKNPLSPKIQNYTISGNEIRFKQQDDHNSYITYKNADLQRVNSIRKIENQNLHAMNEADMLIITDKIFEAQAEEIKEIHEEIDGLHSEIVFVDEIYNEFATGQGDITGIRNFIKMVYKRSDDLKYVLLLGRGTNDYKNIEGYSNSFVPPYEAYNSVNDITAYVSDDYYGLMDDNEGEECKGHVDIGIGRMPVVDADEAEIVVGKIRRYINSTKYNGSWRNEVLLLADHKKEYAKACDALERMVDTMKPALNINKIYTDAYVRKPLASGGYCYPEVTSSLIEKINEGIMLMTYLGHGGVQGLSDSNIFRIKDLSKLTNYNQLPFMVTGTCEMSAFDDATFISLGEKLFKMDEGGAIAMFTTTRPTVSQTNQTIIGNLYRRLFSNDNIQTMRMGDIIRLTKDDNTSNSSNYVSYVFFGDPALRFNYPEKSITINYVNGDNLDETKAVAPMDALTLEGFVRKDNGTVDTGFNGLLYPKMYDNKSGYTTLNNLGVSGNVYSFTSYTDVLYEGKVSVVKGRFSFTCYVPKSVNNQNGMARLSFYAADTIRETDATGYFKNIVVEGHSSVSPDNEGPEIKLLWDGVQDAYNVENHGSLSAELHDPQGIYHYNSTIGRDITLTIESDYSCNTLILNNYYEQTIDDFTSGSLCVDIEWLDEGENKLTLRAWDTHDNSNTATMVLYVPKEQHDNVMRNVMNYPNPFSDYTVINIDYSKKNVIVDVEIQIYDICGRLVNIMKYNNLSSDNIKIEWDGCDETGGHLGNGVYIYKVFVRDNEGDELHTQQKMIIVR